jgi:hypothetical protein
MMTTIDNPRAFTYNKKKIQGKHRMEELQLRNFTANGKKKREKETIKQIIIT